MYYKIKDNILYRQYAKYGYITDNSEYGYQMLNEEAHHPGEKYVSESGAYMLAQLGRTPRHIDEITENLLNIFEGVSYEELRSDTFEFYNNLFQEGYLSIGKTYEECQNESLTPMDYENQDSTIDMTKDFSEIMMSPNDFLRSLHIEIASACNERCVHCYIPHEYKDEVIDTNLFDRIIEQGRKMNIIHVTLSGGEPLIHKDILHFLKKCRELDLSVNVLSNLTLLNDEIIDEMKKNKLLSVQTSLYSMNASEHDAITKMAGSFNKTKEALLKLYDLNIPVQISCPIMKENKRSFIDVVKWGEELGISVAVEPQIFGSYDHSQRNLAHRLSIEEISDALNLELENGAFEDLKRNAEEKESLEPNDSVCSICRYSICIAASGQVYPCVGWQSNVIGDLNKQSLKDIWETSEKIKYLRSIKRSRFTKCLTCKDRGYCTVCMMNNANESPVGDAFAIPQFHCQAAASIHNCVTNYMNKGKDE